MTKEAELILDKKAILAEGPCWDADNQYLLWVDIEGHKVHKYNPVADSDTAYEIGEPVGAVVPRENGGVILAVKDGFSFLDFETGEVTPVISVEKEIPGNRFNDGKCDPAGRFWAGTMSTVNKEPAGNLYCLEKDHSVRKVVENVTTSNGLAWNSDHSIMYYIDTPTKNVFAFDYDLKSGEISNRRVVVTIPEGGGGPDGMTIDREDMIWVAQWGGYQVSRWNPATGDLLETVSVPAAHVSSCAFGGKNLDELYITTAKAGLSEEELKEQPHAGGIFRIKTNTQGYAASKFTG